MVLPTCQTGIYPPLQAARMEPGTLFEFDVQKREAGFQQVAFLSRRILGLIAYTADRCWAVFVAVDGWVHHRSQHELYVVALVALQEGLASASTIESQSACSNRHQRLSLHSLHFRTRHG